MSYFIFAASSLLMQIHPLQHQGDNPSLTQVVQIRPNQVLPHYSARPLPALATYLWLLESDSRHWYFPTMLRIGPLLIQDMVKTTHSSTTLCYCHSITVHQNHDLAPKCWNGLLIFLRSSITE